jgi:1-phosphofructokinase family hexose kinase
VILTVTPNAALDLTWRVDALTPGATHRAPTGFSRAGGKGVNVARVLHAEGHQVLALSTVGGAIGAEFESELRASGIPHRLIRVDAATRRSVALVDESRGETTVLNERGSALAPAEVETLTATAARLGRRARAVVISGSLPPGFGPEQIEALVAELVGAGVPVVVDATGAALLAAARAGATALKPNSDELAEATGERDPLVGARQLLSLGARLVMVTLGGDGLVVLDRSSTPLRARLSRTLHGNPTGAGDAAVAAITAALATGTRLDGDTPEGARAREKLARRAAAWSASAVLMPQAGELSSDHTAFEVDVTVQPVEEERP